MSRLQGGSRRNSDLAGGISQTGKLPGNGLQGRLRLGRHRGQQRVACEDIGALPLGRRPEVALLPFSQPQLHPIGGRKGVVFVAETVLEIEMLPGGGKGNAGIGVPAKFQRPRRIGDAVPAAQLPQPADQLPPRDPLPGEPGDGVICIGDILCDEGHAAGRTDHFGKGQQRIRPAGKSRKPDGEVFVQLHQTVEAGEAHGVGGGTQRLFQQEDAQRIFISGIVGAEQLHLLPRREGKAAPGGKQGHLQLRCHGGAGGQGGAVIDGAGQGHAFDGGDGAGTGADSAAVRQDEDVFHWISAPWRKIENRKWKIEN